MNQNSKLCKDPLFQLNLAIWLTQAQPPQSIYVYPLFYKSEVSIYSIPSILALPPDLRLDVSGKLNCQEGVKPDLILESSKKERKFCLLECKGTSFGSDSSTARQSMTLLLMSGPILSEVLAIEARRQYDGMLCYLLDSNQISLMEKTLEFLKIEIKNKVNLDTGDYGCFGIKSEKSAILLEYPLKIKNFLHLIEDSPVTVLNIEENTDPRPLYFIPYDPNIEQTKEEQELCRRILYERILSYIISNIGDTSIPASVNITTDELLNSATFGVYEILEDTETKRHLRRLIKNFLLNIINSINDHINSYITFEPQKGWIFNLKDSLVQKEILKQLMKFKPETLDLSEKIKQLDLLDNMEN